ncbi:MAG: hypothetical protein AAFO77_01985 [Pseudomonadota bacterium]
MFEKYFGLVELGFAVIVYGGFIIWQRHSLAKDIKARKEREALERLHAETQENSQ